MVITCISTVWQCQWLVVVVVLCIYACVGGCGWCWWHTVHIYLCRGMWWSMYECIHGYKWYTWYCYEVWKTVVVHACTNVCILCVCMC